MITSVTRVFVGTDLSEAFVVELFTSANCVQLVVVVKLVPVSSFVRGVQNVVYRITGPFVQADHRMTDRLVVPADQLRPAASAMMGASSRMVSVFFMVWV